MMTLDMWITLAILLAAIILFITEWLRVDIVAVLVVLTLMLTSLLSSSEALSGFSNTAVITIAALFVVGGAVFYTGLAGAIGRRILSIAGSDERRLIIVIMVAVALLSGFMSNTGTVAVLLPAIVSLARSAKLSASKLLIPLAFGASLGGALTLIGTPPNLIVSATLRDAGLPPFDFFDFTLVGLILLAIGIGYMIFLGRFALPDRRAEQQDLQRLPRPEELIARYRLPDNLFRLRVRHGSRLIGQRIAETRLRQNFGVTAMEILRPAEPRSVVQFGSQRLVLQSSELSRLEAQPDTVVKLDDVLIVEGDGADVGHAAAYWNLGMQPAKTEDEHALLNQEVGLAEVLIPQDASLIGQTLVDARFGTVYRLTVLAIVRPGVEEALDLKETPLQFGDLILVQGPWENIATLKRNVRDFVVLGQPESMLGTEARQKAPLTLLVLAVMVGLMITNLVSVVTASILAALALVLTGCVKIDEAYRSMDMKSLVLIAGMLPMSIALDKTGIAALTAEGLVTMLGSLGPLYVLAGLFLLTTFFTQVISNTATTVLVAPIALAAAQALGARPQAFLIAVAYAASMAFASPVASPVNTMVLGAGNYRFSDFAKAGVPLIVIMLVVTVLVVPIFWPL